MKYTHSRIALCCLIVLLCISYTYVPARADANATDYTVYVAPFSGQRYHSTDNWELNDPTVILLAVTAVAAVWLSVRGICRGMREQAAKSAAKRAAAAQKSYDILSPNMMYAYRELRTLSELDTRLARSARLAALQAEQGDCTEQAARDTHADEPAITKHQSIHGIIFEVDGYKQRELDRRCESLPSATIDDLNFRLNDTIEFNEALCSFLCTLWAVIGLLGRFNLELMAIGTAVHYCIGWALQRTNIVMASATLRACLRIHYALAKNLLHLLLPAACALVMGSINSCLYVYIPYFACMLTRFIITIPIHKSISRRTGRTYRRPTRTANNAIDYLLRNMPQL